VLFNKDNNAVDVDESSSSLLFCSFVLFNLAYFSGREEKKECNMRSIEGIFIGYNDLELARKPIFILSYFGRKNVEYSIENIY